MHDELVLGFEGLATVADVWLNGTPLLSSDNMFVAHERVLSTPLPAENELLIRFRALDRQLEAKRPRPKWRAPMVENQQLRWFRTTLLGRTPGWSPPAAAVGPWRPVWLETRSRVRLTDINLHTGVHGSTGWVDLSCRARPLAHTNSPGPNAVGNATGDNSPPSAAPLGSPAVTPSTSTAGPLGSPAFAPSTSGIAPLRTPALIPSTSASAPLRTPAVSPSTSGIAGDVTGVRLLISRGSDRHSIPLEAAPDNTYRGRLEIPNAALWWPHTHGEPALYEARLAISVDGSDTEIDVDLGQVGFRTVSLDTSNGDFALSINGVPVFCRGACWTPPDPVSLDTDPESLRQILEQVRAAGMNMLRVGGTMVYESDAFLDLCDTNGILLWQDFMFANMNYPDGDAAFIASVREEARQQLSRLAGRPCLAILCGNSEGEQQAAMWGAPRESWSPPLFHETLTQLAREARPDVPYWPSSAHGGEFPHQGNIGTTSYYGVGAYLRPLEDARRSEVRFASECLAFANIPEDKTLARMPGGPSIRCHHPAWKARTPRDLGAGWDFDDVRDHYLTRLFGINPLDLRYADHDRYVALSRVVSGEVMASALAEWRRKRSTCRGALIWFWRDLWCGAGWGVVDALGTPKAAYHYLRRVCQPLLLSISDEGGNGLYLHVVNEHATSVAATLDLKLYRGGEINVGSASRAITINAREALELPAAALFEGFLDLSYAYRFGPPAHDLAVATLTAANGTPLAQAFHFTTGLSAAREPDVGMTAIARPLPPATLAHAASAAAPLMSILSATAAPAPSMSAASAPAASVASIPAASDHAAPVFAAPPSSAGPSTSPGPVAPQALAAFEVTITTRRFAQSVWIEADGYVADDAYFHLAPGSTRTVFLRRAPNEPVKPLRGRVHALNAHTPAKIEVRA